MKTRGFTLIEVLVALTIMAVMALLAWRGIDAMLRSRDISQSHLEATTRLQTVLEQWQQDLREVQDSTVVSPLAYDGSALRLTRSTDTGLQVVTWSLANGHLDRWTSPSVTTRSALTDAYQQSQQPAALQANVVHALDGVQSWQVLFYRGNGWSNAQSSNDVAVDAAATAAAVAAAASAAASGVATSATPVTVVQIPTGVRITLQFVSGETLTREVLVGAAS